MKKGDCGCTNHNGKRKVKYPSQEAALKKIMGFYLRQNGAASAYPCPNKAFPGVWHIKTPRKGGRGR